MDGGASWATVHGVTKSWTRLSDNTFKVDYAFLKNIESGMAYLQMIYTPYN